MARPKDPAREAEIRTRIGKAFSSLLAQKTWEEISVRDICRESHVSVGSFYYYYPSKDHLMFAKVDAMDHYFDTVVRDRVLLCDFFESIRCYVQAYIFWCRKKGSKYTSQVLKFHLANESEELVEARGVYTCLREIIQRAKNLGDVSASLGTHQMIMELTGAIRGIIFQWCTSPDTFDLPEAGDRLASFYSHGWTDIL